MLRIRHSVQRPRAEKLAEKWHRDVEKTGAILEFLANGRPPIESLHLERTRRSTEEYLRGWNKNHIRPSIECDRVLGTLIDEHVNGDYLAMAVAVFACLYALSASAATRYLVALMNLEVEKYLRCITLAGKEHPLLVSEDELRFAQQLLQLLTDRGHEFEIFQRVIEFLELRLPMTFIPLKIIQDALEKFGFRSRLQALLDSHLQMKRFMTTFRLVSWLHHVPGVRTNNNIIAVLDKHFPSWPWLQAWKPNTDRITRWESGNFSEAQRKKLSHTFDLDGPDIATYTQESLKMSEPECYEHVCIQPQNTESLERYLDLLYQAHSIGSGTLGLFFYLCIDNPPNETALSTVHESIKMGSDSRCSRLLAINRALSPQSTLTVQMRSLTQALPLVKDTGTLESAFFEASHLKSRLSDIMQAAQEKFCAQLESGTGEIIGMLIHDLGKAILQASWFHSYLLDHFLTKVRQFPSQSDLEAIFDQLEDRADSSNALDSRLKSYLASVLGGKGEARSGSITIAAMQEEVRFWKHPPDTFRIELAKTLSKFRRMEYSWYTSCLLVMLNEDDLFISEIRQMIKLGNEQTCLNFVTYLAHRRSLNQLQHECWLLLLVSLIREQAPSFLQRRADLMSFSEWLTWVEDFIRLLRPVRSRLPLSGTVLTQERLSWWETLLQNKTGMRFLFERQDGRGNLTWLYFASPLNYVRDLLDMVRQEQSLLPVHRQIIGYLANDGNNVATVIDCINAINQTSALGRAVCERMLCRTEIHGKEKWSEAEQAILFEVWSRSRTLFQVDISALSITKRLLNCSIAPQSRNTTYRSAGERLQSEYKDLLRRAKELERLRLRLQNQRPQRISTLLQRFGIEDTSDGRAADGGIPDELLDAVELIGEAQYELSFALTGLSDLQRRARGISKDSRMLLVRLCQQNSPRFCIHFSPNDEGRGQHKYWRPIAGPEPESAICTKSLDLFTYYIGRNLHRLLQRDSSSLQSVYSAILKLINNSPDTCLVCSGSMSIKLWKPAACSQACSIKLRKAPLEVRLHNLLVDPLSIDLLLTCIYEAAADSSSRALLPNCSVDITNLRAVINSFPPLKNLLSATDLKAAIKGTDAYGRMREDLLSWLCLRFRGFILATPDGFRIPSMPNTKQFLVVNSSHEKEKLFNAVPASRGASGVVFHGTRASRLFAILADGLQSMTGTSLMLNGMALGHGIYCGDNQATSLPFAGSTGQSWRNSALGHMKIMLGCELAVYSSPVSGAIHVIKNSNSLLVRYVFLLPQNYTPPARHYVEPAMATAFAKLRSGLLT